VCSVIIPEDVRIKYSQIRPFKSKVILKNITQLEDLSYLNNITGTGIPSEYVIDKIYAYEGDATNENEITSTIADISKYHINYVQQQHGGLPYRIKLALKIKEPHSNSTSRNVCEYENTRLQERVNCDKVVLNYVLKRNLVQMELTPQRRKEIFEAMMLDHYYKLGPAKNPNNPDSRQKKIDAMYQTYNQEFRKILGDKEALQKFLNKNDIDKNQAMLINEEAFSLNRDFDFHLIMSKKNINHTH